MLSPLCYMTQTTTHTNCELWFTKIVVTSAVRKMYTVNPRHAVLPRAVEKIVKCMGKKQTCQRQKNLNTREQTRADT